MLPSFIITFREALEVALIIGVILGYFYRTKQIGYNKTVYLGLFFGIITSIVAGIFLYNVAGGFVGRSEAVFEGVMMFFGAALLTSMIFWMMKQKQITQRIESRVVEEISKPHIYGLFFLVFISVLREGVETAIFLNAAALVAAGNSFLGAGLGIATATLVGYSLFKGFMRFKIKHFFNITSVLLILFAAGLVAHGVHEFHEASILPPVIEHVWDVNPPVLADGSYPLMHDHGFVGSILAGIFGYNGNPSLLELLSYISYLVLALWAWRTIEHHKKSFTEA